MFCRKTCFFCVAMFIDGSFYGYAFLYDYYGRKGENTEWKKEYRIMEKKS